MDYSALVRHPLDWLTRLVLRHPWTTIGVAIALTVVSLGYAGTNLGYRTSRLDLLNPNSDYNRLWIEYLDEFGDEDDAVVVVEGRRREDVVPVLHELAGELARENRLFHSVLHDINLAPIRAKGLHYLTADELRGVEQFIDQMTPIVEGNWSRLSAMSLVGASLHRLQRGPDDPLAQGALEDLNRTALGLLSAMSDQPRYNSPWPEMSSSFATLNDLSSEYLITNEGKLGFVLLRLTHGDKASFTHDSEATDTLRRIIAAANDRHPEANIGLTGLPIMENDEMHSSQSSMLWASIVSLLGVAVLFVAGFGGLRHALMANLVLLIGMAWAFGYVTLSVGHLNILSVSFTATLIGIGIDYGVHYVARYLQLRPDHATPEDALNATTGSVGPAIVTGALTTAVAFFAAGFTTFTGVAELGIIAGGGILICCAAELLVLPAAISLIDHSRWGQRQPEPLPVADWLAPLLARPKLLLLSTMLFTVAIGLGSTQLWYDHNLLNMQAAGLESVELERKLLTECNQSVWYAVSIADSREELLARKEKLLAMPSVERTEEIVSLIPSDPETKQPIIARIGQRLAMLPSEPPLVPVDSPEALDQVLTAAQGVALQLRDTETARRLELVRTELARLPEAQRYAHISQYQQLVAADLLARLSALRTMADPTPPQLSDLPSSLVDRFVGQHDRHLLKIYGRGNIWDMTALKTFVGDVRSIDPRATGNPLQAYEASLEMKSSYEEAAGYALIVIMAVLWIDFRHVGYALLAAMPLAVGVVQMFGVMGLLNIPLNPANMIALPLILGIGVDYGVHLVHDYRTQRGRFQLSPSTAVAVMVDSLTTIVGFGSLMIASHQGLQSLGRTLTIGVTCCLFTSMVMLPALLTLMSTGRRDEDAEKLDALASLSARGRLDPAHADNAPHGQEAATTAPVGKWRRRSV